MAELDGRWVELVFTSVELVILSLLGLKMHSGVLYKLSISKNRQSRTTCSYFCSREIKNRNGLACNPDETEDHLCSCFQSITLPGID